MADTPDAERIAADTYPPGFSFLRRPPKTDRMVAFVFNADTTPEEMAERLADAFDASDSSGPPAGEPA